MNWFKITGIIISILGFLIFFSSFLVKDKFGVITAGIGFYGGIFVCLMGFLVIFISEHLSENKRIKKYKEVKT